MIEAWSRFKAWWRELRCSWLGCAMAFVPNPPLAADDTRAGDWRCKRCGWKKPGPATIPDPPLHMRPAALPQRPRPNAPPPPRPTGTGEATARAVELRRRLDDEPVRLHSLNYYRRPSFEPVTPDPLPIAVNLLSAAESEPRSTSVDATSVDATPDHGFEGGGGAGGGAGASGGWGGDTGSSSSGGGESSCGGGSCGGGGGGSD